MVAAVLLLIITTRVILTLIYFWQIVQVQDIVKKNRELSKMKTKILILFYLFFIPVVFTVNAQNPVLEPFTYSFDFESGSVGSWSSYPPAQDIAYDPTIWVKKIPAFSNSLSLVREITPNYEIEYIFGVRKKVDIYVNQSSILSFNYYIKNRFETESIRVKFGFEDGTMIEKDIPHNSQLITGKCKIKFSEIILNGSIKHLEGFAIMANCKKADPEALFRFGIDDVNINGLRAKNWIINSPEVHKLDEWKDFISAKHFEEGDKFLLSGSINFKTKSAELQLSRALTGEDLQSFTMRRNSKGEWYYNIQLDPSKGTGAGMWRVTLKAFGKKGESITSSLVFLVKPNSFPKGHPRLFMTPGDKHKILSKASSGHLKKVWEHIQTEAKEMRDEYDIDSFNYNLEAYDEIFWLPTYTGYVTAIKTPAAFIRNNAIEYSLSGKNESGEAARRALLKMADWPTYVHPHILNQGQFTYWPVGLVLIDLALGYDFVYNFLSSPDRTKIADALYNKGIIPVFKEYVRDNRVSGNTSNWISHVTGGGILCAVAIMNEYSDKQLEPYLTGMILKLGELVKMTFDRDGSYGEGYSYHNFTMQTLSEIMPVLERNFGVKFPETVANSYKYLIYQMNPATNKLLEFGDTNDKYFGVTGSKFFPMSNFAHLIGKYRNPHLKWLYDLSPGYSDRDLFFLDETVIAKNPEHIPKIKLFRDVGTVIFRSGFDTNDFIFVFRCGPFYNHQHFDQGSFFLSDLGNEFITEAGKTDYYDDPWYQKLFIQPGGHNCILINGNPESQRAGDIFNDVRAWQDYAKITDFIVFKMGAFVSGDLTKIYKGQFRYLSRNVLYLKPRTILLIDEGLGTTEAKEMNLRFHSSRKKDIQIDGNTSIINRPKGSLFIYTISPEDYTSEILKRPMSLAEFKKENAITMKAKGFLQLTSHLKPEGITWINLLTTDKDIIANLNVKKSISYTLLRIDNNSYLINKVVGKSYKFDNIKTDALIYSSQKDSYTAFKVKYLYKGENKIVEASSPISITVDNNRKPTIKYSASKRTKMHFFLKNKPHAIELNGKKIDAWIYKYPFLEFNILKGNGIIRIL
jgi:hypothetical protein